MRMEILETTRWLWGTPAPALDGEGLEHNKQPKVTIKQQMEMVWNSVLWCLQWQWQIEHWQSWCVRGFLWALGWAWFRVVGLLWCGGGPIVHYGPVGHCSGPIVIVGHWVVGSGHKESIQYRSVSSGYNSQMLVFGWTLYHKNGYYTM
jgi:hypothetical protein